MKVALYRAESKAGRLRKLPDMIRWLILLVTILCVQVSNSAFAASGSSLQLKELNFVLLHGLSGTSCAMQLLADSISEQAQAYISDYEQNNPGVKVQINMLERCYPNDVDIATWAKDIADSVDKHFQNKKNLIIIGHSMGGKAALYAVAQNIQKLADRVTMVVTINSPIKSLNNYYVVGGGSAADYCRARWLLSDVGGCNSVGSYDSSQDGNWVSHNRHWLAFISGESAPLSSQFNIGGVDGWPRDMDDGIVPISAQYSEGADVVYYGEYAHSDFLVREEVAGFIAEQTLRYLFGGVIECSVFTESGTFEHRAGWFPVKYQWEDEFGETVGTSGVLSHTNDSFWKWREWEDAVGGCSPGSVRSSYSVRTVNSFPFLTGIKEVRWLNPDTPEDCWLYVKTKAAPRNSVELEWTIFQHELLPPGTERDHYEVKILAGISQGGVPQVSWATNDTRDTRLQVLSQIEGPFRWFQAEWKVYHKENRQRKVIDEIPAQVLAGLPGD